MWVILSFDENRQVHGVNVGCIAYLAWSCPVLNSSSMFFVEVSNNCSVNETILFSHLQTYCRPRQHTLSFCSHGLSYRHYCLPYKWRHQVFRRQYSCLLATKLSDLLQRNKKSPSEAFKVKCKCLIYSC